MMIIFYLLYITVLYIDVRFFVLLKVLYCTNEHWNQLVVLIADIVWNRKGMESS